MTAAPITRKLWKFVYSRQKTEPSLCGKTREIHL